MWAQVASGLRDYKPSMYLLCFSVFPIWSITFGLLRQCGGGELGRRFSLAGRAMERIAARSACGDQRGGSPRSSAVQCESSSPLQLPPPLTMVLRCFSSGSAARDGDLCGEGREEGVRSCGTRSCSACRRHRRVPCAAHTLGKMTRSLAAISANSSPVALQVHLPLPL